MADAGLIVGWKDTKPGREKQALELFGASLSFYTQAAEKGQIESFEPVILHRHGGDMNGFIIIRGSLDQITTFKSSDEFRAHTIQAIYCLDDFGIVEAYLGDSLMQIMGEWGQLVSKG